MIGVSDADVSRAQAIAVAAGWDPAWIRTPGDVRATLGGCRFDLARAERVREFIQGFCRHTKGKWIGERFMLLPWQYEDVIAPIFGWVRPDGTRRFRRAYVSTGKKSGKSALASAIALYLLIADDQGAPEIYLAARDRWQASIVFENCARMVRQSPALARQVEIIDSRKVITFAANGGKLEALSADAPKTEGISISGLIFDELHVADRALYEALQYGGAAREAPLALAITTAGVADETTIGWEQYQYARRVLDGTIDDDSYFAAVWEVPLDADWTDPAVWPLANPSIGVTVTVDELAEQCRAAQASPPQQSVFRRYRCNSWQQQSERAVDLAVWDLSAGHSIAEDSYAGAKAFGGLDLAATSDLNALAWLVPCPHDPEAVDLICRAWVPEGAVAKARAGRLYDQWIASGVLRTMPGAVANYGFIKQAILEDAGRWVVDSIGVDRLFQGLELASDLEDEGFTVAPVGMGYMSMGPLVREFERLVTAGRLHHGGHPVLRWCVDNLEVKTDPAGNRKPTRASADVKIDLVIAVLLAIDRWARQHAAPAVEASVYLTRGVRTLGQVWSDVDA
jgi:phage terminase large subunit-like protein